MYIYVTRVIYSAIKRQEFQPFVTTLLGILLSKISQISQPESDKYCDFTWNLNKASEQTIKQTHRCRKPVSGY